MTAGIHTQDLCRHYHMGGTVIRAVDNVTLTIADGEFVALLGASGSGKSSLLNLIAGLDSPTSGTVVSCERDLSRLSRSELAAYRRSTVGMVFQSFNLIPRMTMLENVELPLRFAEIDRGKRLDLTTRALQRVGLSGRLHHRPSALSGGEQQRVAIARALVTEPKILLADEPTGNLDSRTGKDVMDLIRTLNRSSQMTVVLVTHEQNIADTYAERMISLADGKVISDVSKAKTTARGEV